MNLLDKRPLSIILAIMLGGLVFFAYSPSDNLGIVVLLSVSVIFLISFFVYLLITKRKRLILLVISGALLFTLLFAYLYFGLWFKAYERFEDEVTVEGMVSSIDTSGAYGARVTVKTNNINGKAFTSYKILLSLTLEDIDYLSVGAKITFKGSLEKFENFSDSFDSEKYYASLGYNAICNDAYEIKVTEYTNGGLSEKLTYWRDVLSRRSIMISDADSGSFLAGLLLGERKYLQGKVGFDFTRSGVSHILALSGMHFVILGMGIERLLTMINVNKRWRKVAIIFFAIAYTALTGAAASVLRSGIMLVVASLLYLICGSRDSLTNMLVSCILICFATPYSVYSMSLWLSAFATFGIIAMGEFHKQAECRNLIKRFAVWLWESYIATFFAVGATFCIMATTFAGTSNMMIPANLICGPLSDLYLYIGSIALIIGDIIPIGKLLIPIFRLISYFIDLTSSPKLGYVSTEFASVEIITFIFIVLYFVFLLAKIKRKRLFFSILTLLFVSIFVTATLATHIRYNEDAIVYIGEGKHDCVLVKSQGELMVVDSASYTKSAAYTTVEVLTDENVFYLDKYIITHYSMRLDDMLSKLATNIKIEDAYLPHPKNDEERLIANTAIKILEGHKINLMFYIDGGKIKSGEYVFTRQFGVPYNEGSAACAYTLDNKNKRTLYLSSGILDSEAQTMATELIADSTALLLGCHGKSYSEIKYFKHFDTNLDYIILGSENLALTQDCYAFYKELGKCVESHPNRVELYVE